MEDTAEPGLQMPQPISRTMTISTFLVFAVLGSVNADEMLPRVISGHSQSGIHEDQKAGAIGVKLDFARILTFGQPARTIILGNPAIVDGTLSDESTIVLTGKAIGTTNLIVLGDTGREIANLVVNVSANNSHVTTVHHGNAQQVFTCADFCRPVVAPGEKK